MTEYLLNVQPGLAAGGAMWGYGASAVLDAGMLYALPYAVIGVLYLLVGRQAEAGKVLAAGEPPCPGQGIAAAGHDLIVN